MGEEQKKKKKKKKGLKITMEITIIALILSAISIFLFTKIFETKEGDIPSTLIVFVCLLVSFPINFALKKLFKKKKKHQEQPAGS